ncbi:hypothetical protein [Pseudoalteromonas sp. T1lg76]|uniref:hypothetical protein n=1 Tax=Pseudoalteromonas sp. T1lg76 TaxID=2077103 RepID=UPI000CF6A092|nr:hypothetical protein [Pseudoalteromonas sp. T1lg76]
MKYAFYLLAPMAATLSSLASAEPLSFEQAKSRADNIEASMSANEAERLVKAQGKLASSAFPHCLRQTSSIPIKFTVVVQIDASGQVINSWHQGSSKFSECFADVMASSLSYTPDSQPFYTSFEFKNVN